MVITRLAIAGYRSFRDMCLALAPLTIVTGANGSGKSSLYRALRLLADIAQGRIVQSLATEGGLNSTLWAGPASFSRAVRRGELPVEGLVRKAPIARPRPRRRSRGARRVPDRDARQGARRDDRDECGPVLDPDLDMAVAMKRLAARILLRKAGEGDHPQGGGGGRRASLIVKKRSSLLPDAVQAAAPSTMLRMVPLPRCAEEDARSTISASWDRTDLAR